VEPFEDLLGRGEVALAEGAWHVAEELFRKAAALRPQSAHAHTRLGVALARQGRYEEALACFREALQLDPGYAPAYCNMGTVHGERGELEGAVGRTARPWSWTQSTP